jgi:hypothetical protein
MEAMSHNSWNLFYAPQLSRTHSSWHSRRRTAAGLFPSTLSPEELMSLRKTRAIRIRSVLRCGDASVNARMDLVTFPDKATMPT